MKLTPKQESYVKAWIRDCDLLIANEVPNKIGITLQRNWMNFLLEVNKIQ